MELLQHPSLRNFVTFGVESTCRHLYSIEDTEELALALGHLERPLILGGGSNVLPIGDLDRDVLRISLKGIEWAEGGDDPLVRVAAGETWHEVVLWALDHDLGGIENLALIPGTMGAAPIQNIGAYGVELESVFHHLEAMRIADGQVEIFDHARCRFGYRDSIFKQEARDRYVITAVTLRLHRRHTLNTSYGAIGDTLREWGIADPTIQDVSRAVIHIRQSKLPDPAVIGNAGSFFKNPVIPAAHYDTLKQEHPSIPGYPAEGDTVKVPAGWLIEQCGWKGKTLGRAGCYEKQALVLVNRGGATGEEIWSLAEAVMLSVRERFGITLQPEVNVWRG